MATNPVKRGILREMLERPLRIGPGQEFKITPGGRELLFIAFVAERWLQSAPSGPIRFDSEEAEVAVAALVDGWSSTTMHALALGPANLDALHRSVEGLGRQALRRQLTAMHGVGQVEAVTTPSGAQIYAPADWLRAGIAPLAAAARLELRKPVDDMTPIAGLDIEAGLLLTLPLLELHEEISGSCQLSVELDEAGEPTTVGISAVIEAGRVVSCAATFEEGADAWASATIADWLDTVIEPDAKRVRTGGKRRIAAALLSSLHAKLFGVPLG